MSSEIHHLYIIGSMESYTLMYLKETLFFFTQMPRSNSTPDVNFYDVKVTDSANSIWNQLKFIPIHKQITS